jgi:hypothetical protein
MAGSDDDHGGSRRHGTEDRGWSGKGWDSVAGRSTGRVTPCVVCTAHEETRSAGFLVESQNQGRWFVCGLASKLLG